MKKQFLKIVSLILVINLSYLPFFPMSSHALTSGPNQPEFASFEPVATTNMVNEFTGDFTYNLPILEIPGPSGSGYALSLSYHSGASPEEEASWVGYGWTLNPGAIIRQKRGFPDDYNGKEVIYSNKVPKNWTISAGGHIGNLEAFSIDVPLELNGSIRYNNYKGFGSVKGIGVSVKGLISLGYSISNGEGSFSVSINPGSILTNEAKQTLNDSFSKGYGIKNKFSSFASLGKLNLIGSQYGLFSYAETVRPTTTTSYTGASHNFNVSLEGVPGVVPAGAEGGFFSNYTWQQNREREETLAYGYMYSGEAAKDVLGEEETTDEERTNKGCVMDYYLEKDTPYQKRDKFLAIPFSNADYFVATGEGIGGGFRLHSKKVGHFYPNQKRSEIGIYQEGLEGQAGCNVGIGKDAGIGKQTLEVKKWKLKEEDNGFNFPTTDEGDEPYFFRFSNDLGGSVEFASDDEPMTATIDEDYHPDVPLISPLIKGNRRNRSGRSSYITYHTNAEMVDSVPSDSLDAIVFYKSYTKDKATRKFVNRTGGDSNPISDGIGEIVIFNEDGQRYVYGLPVYSKNEINMHYGLQRDGPRQIEENYLAYRDISDNSKIPTIVGEERREPYATSYLLTEITTPDYIDRTLDGPTPDDFGGYTKFSYKQVYGTKDGYKDTGENWYKWRIPYTGLLYQENSLSDPSDDLGSLVAGEKEIYYLESIETKTHKAIFSTEPRDDGIEAADNDTAANDPSASGIRKLKQLDKISLYAKGIGGDTRPRLIKTINFEYDYSLMKNLPNSIVTGNGKLTLKKVWFEYEGVVNTKISPYVFGYQYGYQKKGRYVQFSYPEKYKNLYQSEEDNYGYYSLDNQNPGYSPFNIDRWGNYQYGGGERHRKLNPWVNQNPDYTQLDPKFDPAAWQLKFIRLPSGGEIHIQYEQDDYSYVQDRPAMAMVSLSDQSSDNENEYYLNTSELGISNNEDLIKLRDFIRKEIVIPKKKIYFKFLYRLFSPHSILSPLVPNLEDCNAEYITGYANVSNVEIDGNGLKLILAGGKKPRNVGIDFVKTHRLGKLVLEDECDASRDGVTETGSVQDIVMSFLSWLAADLLPGDSELCPTFNPGLSYFRIPLIKAKKGGGIRVKRLMMFDRGIEEGDAILYGNEYIYKTYDPERKEIISSGVATTEPSRGREENALVTYLPRFSQGFLSKIIAGEDKKQVEGPIGETILPAPLVGYSRVITKNIHSGKTNTGIVVNEFYTAKDYPFEKYYGRLLFSVGLEYLDELLSWRLFGGDIPSNLRSEFEANGIGLSSDDITISKQDIYDKWVITDQNKNRRYIVRKDGDKLNVYPENEVGDGVNGKGVEVTSMKQEDDWLIMPLGLFNYYKNNLWLTQGFRFILNSMHGQPKKIAAYSSDYGDIHNPDTNTLTSEQEFTYFKPGENVPMMYAINDIREESPGKEVEIVSEAKAVEDITEDGSVEGDANIGVCSAIPVLFISGIGSISYLESKLRTHVTSKVIRYPAILKSVKTYQDGVYQLSENVAFNPDTGKPILTRTTDGYHGLPLQGVRHEGYYYNYTFPASQQYTAMGQKAENENKIVKSEEPRLVISKIFEENKYYLEFNRYDTGTICDELNSFVPGDLVELTLKLWDETTELFYYEPDGIYHIGEKTGNRIELLPTFSYSSIPQSRTRVIVRIIRSGRTNLLNATAGTIRTYGDKKDVVFHPIDRITREPRERLADWLNDYIQDFISSGLDESDPIRIPEDILKDILVLDSEGNCSLPDDCKIAFRLPEPHDNQRLNRIETQCGDCSTTFNVLSFKEAGFKIDPWTGDLVFYSGEGTCGEQPVPCFHFCPQYYGNETLDGVIDTSAQTFSDHWNIRGAPLGEVYDITKSSTHNPYEIGAKGKWRPKSTFAYLTDIISANDDGRVYKDAGVFNDFTLFNWKHEDANDTTKWLRTNTITKYSPNGNPLEDKNIRDIYSTAKFGYHHTVPYLVAQNAEYTSVDFESFENSYEKRSGGFVVKYFEDGLLYLESLGSVDNTVAHAGSRSFKWNVNKNFKLKGLQLTKQIQDNGLSLKVWVKSGNPKLKLNDKLVLKCIFSPDDSLGKPFKKIAKTGEWLLLKAIITKSELDDKSIDTYPMEIQYKPDPSEIYYGAEKDIWLDDIRIQPLDTQMTTYVYDTDTLRLLTSFDDQHFGLYYQYNSEGKLVRKLIETERGIKTIQETQYHTPQVDR